MLTCQSSRGCDKGTHLRYSLAFASDLSSVVFHYVQTARNISTFKGHVFAALSMVLEAKMTLIRALATARVSLLLFILLLLS
jgi:hypothetical protein